MKQVFVHEWFPSLSCKNLGLTDNGEAQFYASLLDLHGGRLDFDGAFDDVRGRRYLCAARETSALDRDPGQGQTGRCCATRTVDTG